MNRERAKELLPIIQAFADGKTIQFRDDISSYDNLMPLSEFSDWQTIPDEPDLKFHDGRQYRIKPEPREFWIIRDKRKIDNSGKWLSYKPTLVKDKEVIKVREVLDDENPTK